MANLLTFTKEAGKYLISGMTGAGITLAALLAWTGAEDLQAIKQAVNQTVDQTNLFANEMSSSYLVEINKANAEIEDYQKALEQANANIVALKTEYDKMADMLTEAEANEIIAKANAEIQQANKDVADAKASVERATSEDSVIAKQYQNEDGTYNVSGFIEQRSKDLSTLTPEQLEEILGISSVEDTTAKVDGDKTVVDLPEGVTVPTEQPQE
jgi:chromosome segregation ATPase